jgi:hypothetical protein
VALFHLVVGTVIGLQTLGEALLGTSTLASALTWLAQLAVAIVGGVLSGLNLGPKDGVILVVCVGALGIPGCPPALRDAAVAVSRETQVVPASAPLRRGQVHLSDAHLDTTRVGKATAGPRRSRRTAYAAPVVTEEGLALWACAQDPLDLEGSAAGGYDPSVSYACAAAIEQVATRAEPRRCCLLVGDDGFLRWGTLVLMGFLELAVLGAAWNSVRPSWADAEGEPDQPPPPTP